MINLAKTTQPQKLFASRRRIFLVNRGQEALDFGALVANNEAAQAILCNVLIRHIQLVYKLSSMGSEWLALSEFISMIFAKFLHHSDFWCLLASKMDLNF